MIRLVVACIHHDAHDSTVRCFASLNCACCSRFNFCKCVNAASSLDQIRRHFSSFARSEKLFSRIQLGSFTPDEVIDPGTVPRTAVLAHMLRTSLKTAIICLAPQTWLMCLLRQTTRRVLFIALALVATSTSNTQSRNCTCGTSTVFCTVWVIGSWRCIATGAWTILSMMRFETRSWGMIWTTSTISPTTLWFGDVDNLLHGALLKALLCTAARARINRTTSMIVHDLRNVLNRHLRLAIWTQLPKITILASISPFLSRRVDIECVRSVTSSVSSLECPINVVSWSPAPTSRSSRPTLTPPAMSGPCLLIRMALAAFRSASDRHLVRGRQSSCATPQSRHRAAPNPLDLSCSVCTAKAGSLICDSHQTENTRYVVWPPRFLHLGLKI